MTFFDFLDKHWGSFTTAAIVVAFVLVFVIVVRLGKDD
jgi:hypothetical protein